MSSGGGRRRTELPVDHKTEACDQKGEEKTGDEFDNFCSYCAMIVETDKGTILIRKRIS